MNANIKYNSVGVPISGYITGGAIVMSASDVAADPKVAPGAVQPSTVEAPSGSQQWVNWGPGNNYPILAAADFRKNGVAARALKLRSEMLYGKRVIACKVTGFDDNAQKEIVEVIEDPRINEFLKRSNINAFRNRAVTDFVWWGMIFPMFLLNPDRSEISMVVHDKAAKFRFAPFNLELGRIDSCYRSANWPWPNKEQYEEIKAIDSYMSYLEVDRVRYEDNVYKYVFPIQSYDVLNDYYAVTIHESLRANGTLANANAIPAMVSSMIKNVASIKYHIRIPASYWTSLYPNFLSMKQDERDAIVNSKLQEMNDFLTGKENQMKAFISQYMTDKNTGKEVSGWEIITLDDKMKYDAWTGVESASNAAILFAMGVNPAIFGLGSPGGAGKGGDNNGGSNIREAWLIMLSTAAGDRDTLYSWWPFVREYNGYDPDVELRTMDQVLTTLDQGKGTAKTLS